MKGLTKSIFIVVAAFAVGLSSQTAWAGRSLIEDGHLYVPRIDIFGFGAYELVFQLQFDQQIQFVLVEANEAALSVQNSGIFDPVTRTIDVDEIELPTGQLYAAQLVLVSEFPEVVFGLADAVLLDDSSVVVADDAGGAGGEQSDSGGGASNDSGGGAAGDAGQGDEAGTGSDSQGDGEENEDAANDQGSDDSNGANGSSDQQALVSMGSDLYAQYCMVCHGTLDQSAKRDATVGRIRAGLLNDAMAYLSSDLAEIELLAIEAALNYVEPDNDASGNGSDSAENGAAEARSDYQNFVDTASQAQVDSWIERHDDGLSVTEQEFTRYIYLSDEIYQNEEHRNLARVCASKAINSVATLNPAIINPADASDGHGIVFAIDLRDYFPNEPEQKWSVISGSRTRQSMSVDQFAYNVHHWQKYGDITDHPDNDVRENMIGLGIEDQEPDIRMAMENAITFGVRYVEAYSYQAVDRNGNSHERQYWRSGDPVYATDTDTEDGYMRFKAQCFAKRDQERPVPLANSVAAQELTWDDDGGKIPPLRGDGLPSHPDICAGGSATGSEAWRSLPNGMIQFYLWGNGNQRINRAASTLIQDPLQREMPERQELGVGQCAYCHVSGTMHRVSDMALAKERGLLSNRGVAEFWSDQIDIDNFYANDTELFKQAIRTIVEGMSDDASLNEELTEFRTVEPCYTISGYAI